jgi:hypothetical protein
MVGAYVRAHCFKTDKLTLALNPLTMILGAWIHATLRHFTVDDMCKATEWLLA